MSRRKPAPNSPHKPSKSASPRADSDETGDGLTHLDRHGRIRMVDIGEKSSTRRLAVARGILKMSRPTLAAILGGKLRKGHALAAAQLAGIMAAKRTHELIPLCHQIQLESVRVEFKPTSDRRAIQIEARALCEAKTGVEMEALVAVSAAALTLYDMAKAIDRAMVIGDIRLVRKTGGRSSDFVRPHEIAWSED